MELLLILSAMLSAVTGAFSGVRGPEAGVHQAESSVGAQLIASVVEERVAKLASVFPPDDAATTEVHALPGFAIAAAMPLYADRLIE
jgi:hypothetical protein